MKIQFFLSTELLMAWMSYKGNTYISFRFRKSQFIYLYFFYCRIRKHKTILQIWLQHNNFSKTSRSSCVYPSTTLSEFISTRFWNCLFYIEKYQNSKTKLAKIKAATDIFTVFSYNLLLFIYEFLRQGSISNMYQSLVKRPNKVVG